MKNTARILGLLAAVGGLLGSAAQAEKAPFYFESYTGRSFEESAGLSTLTYLNVTLKFNDRYSFVPETRNDITYPYKAKDFDFTHKYLRFVISDNALAKLNDNWTLAMNYRYRAPTNLPDQLAGNLGAVGFRPTFKGDFGAFKLTIRNMFQFPLNRNNYQRHVADRTKAEGNTVFSSDFEVLPSYDLGSGLELSGVAYYSLAVKGKNAQNPKFASVTTTNLIGYEAELSYTIAPMYDTVVGINFANESAANDYKIVSGKTSSLNLKLAKTF